MSVPLGKSQSCSKVAPGPRGSQQQHAARAQTKKQSKQKAALAIAATAAPSAANKDHKLAKKNISDEGAVAAELDDGLLKCLKDLEWEWSELVSDEEAPKLLELGCSGIQCDPLHRLLISMNQKLLSRYRVSTEQQQQATNRWIGLKARMDELQVDYDVLSQDFEVVKSQRDAFMQRSSTNPPDMSDHRDPMIRPEMLGFGSIGTTNRPSDDQDILLGEHAAFHEPIRWISKEDLSLPIASLSIGSEESLDTRQSEVELRPSTPPTSTKELMLEVAEERQNQRRIENTIIADLRIENSALKRWKEDAILDTVEKDRLLAEMEQQLVDLQREFDESKEECLGHQKVIQELRSSLDQVQMGAACWPHPAPPTPRPPSVSAAASPSASSSSAAAAALAAAASVILSRPCSRIGLTEFKSSFARTLDINGPDRMSWLEQELLRSRQRCIQIEADFERLHHSHWALLEEYEHLKEDFRSLHLSLIKNSHSCLAAAPTSPLQVGECDRLVERDEASLVQDKIARREAVIKQLRDQCQVPGGAASAIVNHHHHHHHQMASS